jgi:hypothetical protein
LPPLCPGSSTTVNGAGVVVLGAVVPGVVVPGPVVLGAVVPGPSEVGAVPAAVLVSRAAVSCATGCGAPAGPDWQPATNRAATQATAVRTSVTDRISTEPSRPHRPSAA